MKKLALCLSLAAFLSSCADALPAQTSGATHDPKCPMHQHDATDSHDATVRLHGDEAMRFSHAKTTHHFRFAPDGGAIQVTANDAADKTSIEAIRMHLTHITAMFADGDFSTPMFVHDTVPPGVTTMKLLRDKIHFTYQEIDSGASVRIESGDQGALAAIHDFLRFQITDHQTGDPLAPEPRPVAKIYRQPL
jgi:hypothetical protein